MSPDRSARCEVERHGAEDFGCRPERERDERSEAELLRDLVPVGERCVGEQVGHVDGPTLARGLAARTGAKPNTHLAEEAGVLFGPIVRRGKPHQVGILVDHVDACERRADNRTHMLERETVHVLRPIGGKERVHDLADDQQLAHAELGRHSRRAMTIGRW